MSIKICSIMGLGEDIIFEEIDEEMPTFHGISHRNDEFTRGMNCLERAGYFVQRYPILSISGHVS